VVVVLVLAITFVRRPLPDRGGQVQLPGLRGKVVVLRDDRAVPQIYASNAVDLFRVQGYVNAQDRFFEMDLRRHITAGRLSELVGRNADALRSDAMVRTLGWRHVAEQEFKQASPSTRRYLEAYAQGVNDYIGGGRSPSDLSLSYTILGRSHPLARIEPWTPVDSLAWLKAMAWDLRSNYDEELQRARAITTVRDVQRVDQLYPPYPAAEHKPIIPGSSSSASASLTPRIGTRTATTSALKRSGQAAKPRRAPIPDPSGLREALESDDAQQAFQAADSAIASMPDLLGSGDGIGSNSWVVGGSLTASGLPLLENDPHLKVSMPGVWTQVGLHCTVVSAACPFDVSGFGFAGMPGVVIGHNARIAWGLTNLDPDVTDFYLERIVGDKVQKNGAMTPLTKRNETISVAGSSPVTITIRSTSHGPVLSDVLSEVGQAGQSAPVAGDKSQRPDYAVSLAWTALQPGHAMDALLGLDVATDFDQFRTAARKLDAPAQNVVYADVDGHIGYQAPGRIPIRGPGRPDSPVPSDGTWPHPGWDSAYDWKGTVPVKQLPWVEDPAEGMIVAANQAVAGNSSPVKITSDWDYGFRSQRIRDLLTGAVTNGHRLTVADMQVIQRDTRNGIAPLLVPLLLKVQGNGKFTQEAVNLLRGWDYTQPTDSAAAAYFNAVWANILNLAFAGELPEGMRPDGGSRWFEVVATLLNRPHDPWWDDRRTPDVVESRDEVLRRALASARLQLTASLGKDPAHWQWGRLHRLTLVQTPLGGAGSFGLLKGLLNRGPFPAPGGSSIVDAFSWNASSGSFRVVSAPSMRMIVDLSNLDSSRWVNQSGISGHPGDDHYDDQVNTWLQGNDYPWPFTARAVRASTAQEQDFTAGTPGSG
jgi:penicillin amidase